MKRGKCTPLKNTAQTVVHAEKEERHLKKKITTEAK